MASNTSTEDSNDLSTDNISTCDGENNIDRTSLTVEMAKHIGLLFNTQEKISISFLFYDDPDVSLDMCKKVVASPRFKILDEYVSSNPPNCWSMKLLECLYMVKNYCILNSLRIDRQDAKDIFSKSCLLHDRLILYKICDSLSKSETLTVMKNIGCISTENYLELFLLNIRREVDWKKFWAVLKDLNNSKVNSLLEEWESSVKYSSLHVKSIITDIQDHLRLHVPPNKVYPIKDYSNIGLCIIINQMDFKTTHERRNGSERDVEALETTLKSFSFTVKTYTNATKTFFDRDLFVEIKKNYQRNHSVFFMVVMSHGCQGVIYSTDVEPIGIEDNLFRTLIRVPELKNIPKVLVIQACQGDRLLYSRKLSTDSLLNMPFQTDMKNSSPNKQLVVGEYITDILVCMATVPGFRAFRKPDTGSYLIQTLCQCLNDNPHESVCDIFTDVIEKVKSQIVLVNDPNLFLYQLPEFRSLLGKRLYLKPIPPKL